MKKKILVTILMVLMYMIFVSCNSCTSSSAQGKYEVVSQDTIQKYEMTQDTVKSITDSAYVSFTFTPVIKEDSTGTVEVKRVISKKMSVDTTVKIQADSMYQKLEKTQMEIKGQQKMLDSMLIVKRKK